MLATAVSADAQRLPSPALRRNFLGQLRTSSGSAISESAVRFAPVTPTITNFEPTFTNRIDCLLDTYVRPTTFITPPPNIVLDLSPATAQKIGITQDDGVAKVKVDPIAVPMPDGSVKPGVAAKDAGEAADLFAGDCILFVGHG